MLFEQPFARVRSIIFCQGVRLICRRRQVPYENYRKIFRTSQKNVERELGGVQTLSNELLTRASSRSLSSEDALQSIDNMIGKVENLKRKVI